MEETKKTKKEKKGKGLAAALYGVAITLVLQTTITTGRTASVRNERFNGVDSSYFQKTIFNVPLILPVTDGNVNLNIDPAFSEYEKQELVKGIREIDDMIDGFVYTISFNDGTLKKGINIRAFKENEKNKSNGIACATIKANQWKAEITYPVTIKFDTDMMEKENFSYDTVIKHELLHTLGLEDLSDSKYSDNLMYYAYSTSKPKLNEEQIKALKVVYSPEKTGVFGPVNQNPSVNYYAGDVTPENIIEDDILTF